ncbi:MAG: ATP-binding protein [Eubacteriales bacterium]|nr:ATP-binding protein [Eubacteriales bacterium]
MITNNANGEIVRSGVTSEQAFRIKASAKAFKILSSALYSNKIRAIIRELSANAYDAHKEANNIATPFKITLPNALNPNFSIRDYGTGISPENILTVYTTYFESPKTNSNDYIGCMGLGSKTPLCYTDTFLVTSYYNGKKYIYSVFLNETGCPTITLFNEEDTTEHNGLEVSFSVESCDFSTFASEARDTLRYYNPLPIIAGRTDVTLSTIEYIKKGNGWGIRKKNTSPGMYAVMGNIAYPITNREVSHNTSADIDLFFNIGELEVTASREEISYEPETLRVLREKAKAMWNDLQQDANDQLQQADSYWKATQIYSDMVTFYQGTNILQSLSPRWKTKYMDSTNIEFYPTHDIHEKFKSLNFRVPIYSAGPSERKLRNTSYLTLTTKYTFVKCDVFYAVIKRVVSAEKTMNTSIIVFDDPNNLWEEYKKAVGLPDDIPVRNLSEFEYEKEKSEANPVYYKKVLVWNRTQHVWDAPDKFDFNAGGVYAFIERFKINDTPAHNYISKHLELLTDSGIDTTSLVIYGVKEKQLEKFQNAPNWITFDQYCKQQFEAKYKLDTCVSVSLATWMGIQKMGLLHTLSSMKPELQDYIVFDNIPSVAEYSEKQWGDYNRKEAVRSFCSRMYATEAKKAMDDIEVCEKHINKHCPLWRSLNTGYAVLSPTVEAHVKDYLKAFLPKK